MLKSVLFVCYIIYRN